MLIKKHALKDKAGFQITTLINLSVLQKANILSPFSKTPWKRTFSSLQSNESTISNAAARHPKFFLCVCVYLFFFNL